MINIEIYTPKGIEYQGDFDSLQIMDQKFGSFGVLSGHIPVISTISRGYVMTKLNETETYIALEGAVFKFQDDKASVITEIIALGKDSTDAFNNLDNQITKRRNENKERNVELALAENELKKQIKKTGAGHI